MLPKTLSLRQALVLTTEPLAHDRRVNAQVALLRSMGFEVQISELDVSRRVGGNVSSAFEVFSCLLRTLISALPAILQLRRFVIRYELDRYRRVMLPTLQQLSQDILNPIRMGIVLRRKWMGGAMLPKLIVANDLQALIVALSLLRPESILVYDSHEFNLHRRRQNSWLRFFWNYAFERLGVKRSRLVLVVSEGLAEVMRELYPNGKFAIVPNALFRNNSRSVDFRVTVSGKSDVLHLIYIGAWTAGRALDAMIALVETDQRLFGHFFVVNGVVKDLEQLVSTPRMSFHFGSDYQEKLMALLGSGGACLSWCIIENVCLSYRFALPNKYFQSLAVGLPVLVTDEQVLADEVTVKKYGLVMPVDLLKSPRMLADWLVGHVAQVREHLLKWGALHNERAGSYGARMREAVDIALSGTG